MSPKVIAIILNTNRKADTLACLESLAQNDYSALEIIVADNHSTDGSVAAIHEQFPKATLFELPQNLGYAGNNNLGIQLALKHQADWVLILNEDTIVAPDCITRLIQAGESNVQIGMLGPMVYHYDESNVIQSAGGSLDKYWNAVHLGHNDLDIGQYHEPHPVDWLSGCALMVRRAVIEQLGVFDERLFIYWEEIDWCLRARQQAWILLQVPQAKIWHKGVQRNYRPGPSVTYYSIRNQFFMLSKYRAPLTVWLYRWGQTLRTFVSWSIKPKWRHMRGHRDAMAAAVHDFIFKHWGMRVV
jgi:GT2 family glycosyltransferase